MIDLSTLQSPGQLPPQVKPLDNLMQQLTQALSVEPIGAYYQPSNVVRPEFTAPGGHVPTVRRYSIIPPHKITVPYIDVTGPVVGRDTFLEGDVSEADLLSARANIAYLIEAGIIVENGYMRV